MSKKEIISAIEKTIEETREHRKRNPDDATTIISMDNYRSSLETNLNFYDIDNPSFLRALATSIGGPIGFVLSPVILACLGGREIYKRIREHYSSK